MLQTHTLLIRVNVIHKAICGYHIIRLVMMKPICQGIVEMRKSKV